MTPLLNCIYASLSAPAFKEQDLPELLAQARDANALHGLTGMLLYIKGTFFQVLEGEAAAVDGMYNKILRDPRHTHVRQIIREPISRRSFAVWTMAFETMEPFDAGEMVGDTDFLFDAASIEKFNPDRARKLLAAPERRAMEQELERHRHHLDKLVEERTAGLEKTHEAIAAAHRASVERLNAEREAKMQSSKLEAMDTMAAGIAHDFNIFWQASCLTRNWSTMNWQTVLKPRITSRMSSTAAFAHAISSLACSTLRAHGRAIPCR